MFERIAACKRSATSSWAEIASNSRVAIRETMAIRSCTKSSCLPGQYVNKADAVEPARARDVLEARVVIAGVREHLERGVEEGRLQR